MQAAAQRWQGGDREERCRQTMKIGGMWSFYWGPKEWCSYFQESQERKDVSHMGWEERWKSAFTYRSGGACREWEPRYRRPEGIGRSVLDHKQSLLALHLSNKDIQIKNVKRHLKCSNRIRKCHTLSCDGRILMLKKEKWLREIAQLDT